MLKELLAIAPVDKLSYEKEVEKIRTELLNLQYRLLEKGFSVVVLFTGDDRIGATRMLNTFYEWLDAHYLSSKAYPVTLQKDKNLLHPHQQYWKNLPPKGEIAFFINAWNTEYLAKKVLDKMSEKEAKEELEQILAFEQTLTDNGVLFLKFWLHAGKEKLGKRLKKAKKDPEKYWWVQRNDWILYKKYDKLTREVDDFVRQTDRPNSRWHLTDSRDYRARNLHVAKILLNELRFKVENFKAPEKGTPLVTSKIDIDSGLRTVLHDVNLAENLEYETYKKVLKEQQKRISSVMTRCNKKGITNLMVFEGWDAAGKGGVVRRLIYAMDAQYYEVTNISAPTQEELRYHYLHRFWNNLPPKGHCKIFDRSWYGRVLVERVEGFANENEWERAFSEIVNFEHQLCREGVILHKFWLHISPEEQIKRFKKRETITYKNYKITPEDYRNREKWAYYEHAVHDMIIRTSTKEAPWQIIAGEDKKYARTQVLKLIADRLEGI